MKHHIYSFENLEVWQLARKMRVEIYKLTYNFPKEEQYNLTSQLRRSIGSISSNIVEGSGRATDKDKANFTNTSYSSALESLDHLIAAYDLKFIDENEYMNMRIMLDELINKLNAYYKYQIARNSNLKDQL